MGEVSGLIFRVIHIFCGVFWVGAALMLAGFIEPAVTALGSEGGKFMQRMVGPGRFALSMMVASLLTALSGLIMLWPGSGGSFRVWIDTGSGLSILVGGIAGIIALVWGFSVNATAAARMARIGREIQLAGGPPGVDQLAEMTALQKRLHIGGLVSVALLSLSVVAMAAARYM